MTAIRRFRTGDAAATHKVFADAVRIGAAGRYSEAERRDWLPEMMMPDDWGDWLEEHVTLVSLTGKQITGFMMVERDGYLNMAFVRPDQMGKGTTDQLYAALLTEVRALGLTRLHVLASRYAEGFFRRHGWQAAPEHARLEGCDPRQGPDDHPVNRPMKLDPVPAQSGLANRGATPSARTSAMTDPYDPAREGAQMAFDGRMSYGDYLNIDAILGSQRLLTGAHDEMLFIIQHQTSELWMRLALHEIDAARQAIATDDLRPAFKLLARVSRIFEQLNNAWDVLRTMTPSDYTRFRDGLGQSSGFQSWQYRLIEFAVGNRNPAMLRPHAHRPDILARLQAELARPTLYDEALRAMARQGLLVPTEVLHRDVSQSWQAVPAIEEMWAIVYRDPEEHWEAYELAEKLVDFEDYFRRWRFNHVTTVERVIGLKRGTGGTGGVSYLRRMLEVELFPELWHVRTRL